MVRTIKASTNVDERRVKHETITYSSGNKIFNHRFKLMTAGT